MKKINLLMGDVTLSFRSAVKVANILFIQNDPDMYDIVQFPYRFGHISHSIYSSITLLFDI